MKGLCAPSPWAETTSPNLREWAKAILFIARDGQSYSDKLLNAVEHELTEIANKYKQLGFEDGDKNGWWIAQEKGGQPAQLPFGYKRERRV